MNFLWQILGYNSQLNPTTYVFDSEEMLPKQPNLLRRNSKRFVIGDESEDVNDEKKDQKKVKEEEWNRTARFLTVGTTLT